MTDQIHRILTRVQKPARYVGGEYNQIVKRKQDIDVRVAFCFPDTYEIGMSHLGIKILYWILNNVDYIWCERVFAPASDMEAQLPLAYGTALVLIMIILLVNLLANALRKYFEKRVKTN